MENDMGAVVCDCGSGSVKAGFVGEDSPRSIFPCHVGRRRHTGIMLQDTRDCVVGDVSQDMRGLLDIKSPVENGIVINWHDMEKLWEHTFQNELKIKPEEYFVLLTEAPLNPLLNRQKTVEVMFEKYNVKGVYLASQALLGLYSAGRTSGLVLDSGHTVTHWVPVVDGHSLPQGIIRMGFGGRDLTEYLSHLLSQRGFYTLAETLSEKDILNDIKEKLCEVMVESETTSTTNDNQLSTRQYVLPDGNTISLENERFRCPEAMFQPQMMGLSTVSVDEGAITSVNMIVRSGANLIRQQMYQNIVVTGGNSLFKGFKKRLGNEIEAQVSKNYKDMMVNIVAPDERRYAAWIGGAILASLPAFQVMWITRDEYENQGPNIVLRKCVS